MLREHKLLEHGVVLPYRVQPLYYVVETIDFVDRLRPKYGTMYAIYHHFDAADTSTNNFESAGSCQSLQRSG